MYLRLPSLFSVAVILLLGCLISGTNYAQDNDPDEFDNLLLDVDGLDDRDETNIGEINAEQPVPVEPVLLDIESVEEPVASDTTEISETSDIIAINELAGATLVEGGIAKDIIVVLDNSGSMKNNDSEFLTKTAVTEFITGLDELTNLAIIIFDQDVRFAVPLTVVSLENRVKLLESLDQINYAGLFSDSPAAVERAIYELKNNGRESADKSIIFMTDGIVDTGDEGTDRERSNWLQENLANDAADSNIKVFTIAFTDAADLQLTQSLARVSGGEYYQAMVAEELIGVFEQISVIINTPLDPQVEDDTQPLVTQVQSPVQQPEVVEINQQPIPIDREERTRSTIIIVSAIILIITILAILYLLIKRGRESKLVSKSHYTEAYLNDIYGYTSQVSYKLGNKPVMMGRIAGKDSEHLDYIVIPETTIGRRHSLIEYKDYAYWIVDQGSINGTFVNNIPITSEARLKHGDKVRLHKYEFEFVIPEMVDAGKTVVSDAMMPDEASDILSEATEIKARLGEEGSGVDDLDFDLTGGAVEPETREAPINGDMTMEEDLIPGSAEETLIPEYDSSSPEDEAAPDVFNDDIPDSDDETLMPGGDMPVVSSDEVQENFKDIENGIGDADDETLMPGHFDMGEEDDATIRKEFIDDQSDSYESSSDLDEPDQGDRK